MATAKKKVVTKDDLRRLMKEKQSTIKDSSKKVNHPLAKYNSLNQLVCVLCNNIIKNDLLWTSHLQSRQHKEKAVAIKTQGPDKPDHLSNTPLKRKAVDDTVKVDRKRPKSEKNTQDPMRKKNYKDPASTDSKDSRSQVKERARAAFLAGYSSSSSSEESDDDDGDDEEESETSTLKSDAGASLTKSSKTSLPGDFFDSPNNVSSSDEVNPEPSHNKKMSEVLPEGFFDDPKQDAKVREVVYKNKEEEEWELFQKAIKEEAHVSEVIMEEEDEQLNIDRNIDEIDDQIHRWQEVENLHVQKETILKNSKAGGQRKENSEEDVDEDELEEILDWRAKKSLK
ncbi:unnamed protein product [Candidula unifasciata]|uniref:Zinc finger protein 830 n=1 Tax=Candidula unifasciata TaxID=100452 RepID=A0A8S3ZT02_9EUPU|nr:unnamed protein product [Candidula unifasciata]